jgi:hypothetical protein
MKYSSKLILKNTFYSLALSSLFACSSPKDSEEKKGQMEGKIPTYSLVVEAESLHDLSDQTRLNEASRENL